MFIPAKKLGQILIKQHLITPSQLEEAMKAVQESGEQNLTLDQYLVEKGYVEEKAVLKIKADHIGYPYIDLSEVELDPKLVK